MANILLALLLCQDPELDQAVKADRERIAAKKALTADEAKAYVAAAALPKAPAAKARARCTIAIVPVEFDDAKRGSRDLEKEAARLCDFYRAMSGGAFELAWTVKSASAIEGTREAFGKRTVGSWEEKRAIAGLAASAGEGADAVVFVAAGKIGARGTALWPHKDSVELSDRTLDYLVVPEEAEAHWLGILAHEFGHVLALEDKYEDKAAKVGRWCLMGTGYLGDKEDNPMPLCGVCRERLGWAASAVVDAKEAVALALSPGDLARVAMGRDGKEALVLEMRDKATLIAWHTGGGKPIELAGVFPSKATDRLTPWSAPPFMARTFGAQAPWLTDVRVEGGRAFVRLAPAGEPTPLEALRRSRVGKELGK
jgi:M6 family metalloprotease-like protein